jgi:hypothetical protein
MKINNMKSGDDPHPKGELQVREQANESLSFGGGLLALKASRDSTSTGDLVRSAMVLAGGINNTVGWKAKALGWNQELWREKAAGITSSLAPYLCYYSFGPLTTQ